MQPGTPLAHYEILSPLGKGGMGEVWRARDTKLGREVAIKTLPEEFAKDADRLARFEREAKLLASLNHPNIAAIHGFEEDNGTHFLVLELVEGETLAEGSKRGALSVDESVKLALQIGEALEAAHEKGVIHRDLKPANVKVTPDGKVKVLDFGLAKALTGDTQGVNLSQSPTLSMAATAQGVILGTAAYMSPEQARGVEVDKRADIWAFGCILYEMLTARQVFGGELMSDVMASVLKSDPDYQGLPPKTPPRLLALLQRCLQKDPRERWRDVGDLRVELQQVSVDPYGPSFNDPNASGVLSRVVWLGAVAAALVAGWIGATMLRSPGLTGPTGIADLIEFPLILPEGVEIFVSTQTPIAVAPDGRRLVIVATGDDGQRRVWLKNMDSQSFRPLEGTEGAFEAFWAPDSQSIGFITNEGMSRVPISGGNVRLITEGQGLTHGNWGTNDTILFTSFPSLGIRSVPTSGGDATLVGSTGQDGGNGHFWPLFLNDGRRFIYHSLGVGIVLGSVDGDELQVLLERNFDQRSSIFLVPGYLLYVEDHVLRARSFDQETLELGEEAVPIRDAIPTTGRGIAPVSLSSTGVLAYWPRPVGEATSLQWFNRSGDLLEAVGSPGIYNGFSLSPGGDRVAFSRIEPTGMRDIWTLDGQGREVKITFDGDSSVPVWAPDGENLVFASARLMPPNLFRIPSTGGDAERLTEALAIHFPGSWTPDQNRIVYEVGSGRVTDASGDIRVLDLETGDDAEVPVNSDFGETLTRVSPNGRWLAYVYDGSDQSEVWLASFPDASMTTPLGPGLFPEWGNGELYYMSDDSQMMSLEFDTAGAGPNTAVPMALFQVPNFAPQPELGTSAFQVTPDGERFLISVGSENFGDPPINVVLNWTALLEE